jgi:hypothetical protein
MNDRVDPGERIALQAAATRGRRSRTQQQQGSPMGAIFNVFPLILIPVLTYNIWAFGSTAANNNNSQVVRNHLGDAWLNVPMASGVEWVVSFGDVLVLMALILLFIELLKSTSTGTAAIFNHALSMLVFIICLVEFLLHPAFATSVFFVILVMALLDVLAGVVVTIISARRDVEFAGQH